MCMYLDGCVGEMELAHMYIIYMHVLYVCVCTLTVAWERWSSLGMDMCVGMYVPRRLGARA